MAWWRWRLEEPPSSRPSANRRDVILPCTRISADRLVAECQAFLAGRLVDQSDARHIPVWNWTNLLAHGSEEELRAQSVEDCRDEWRRARAYIASLLLDLASSHGPLQEIQRLVLVPLELEFAGNPEVAAWDPRGWASAVERALESYRRQCRRAADN